MALEASFQSVAMRRFPPLKLSFGSQSQINLDFSLVPLGKAVRQRGNQRMLTVCSAGGVPTQPNEEGKGQKSSVESLFTNPAPGAFWKPMPEPREFSYGNIFPAAAGHVKHDRHAVDKKKKELYEQIVGAPKGKTRDPKLIKLLNHRLTAGEHKGKMLRDVSKKYLEWLATRTASLQMMPNRGRTSVVLRTKGEITDVGEMAAIVLQLPEIKDTVRQVDVDEAQETGGKGKKKGGEAERPDDVYRAAALQVKSLAIQAELEKAEREARKEATRMAVEANVIEDPFEARRQRRRVKQWEEAEERKKVSLAKIYEERALRKTEVEAEEDLKTSYGVAASRSPAALPQLGELKFKGREEMLRIARQAQMKAALDTSRPKDAGLELGRSGGTSSQRSLHTGSRGQGPAKETGEGGAGVDWRKASRRKPSS